MFRLLVLAWLAFAGGSAVASAAEPMRCLSVEERRAAITAQKAVPLVRAIRAARVRSGGDLVRARLCEGGGRLVYLLTLLARDGKVTRVTIDAGSGRLIGRR